MKKGYHIAHEASQVDSEEYTGLHGRDEFNAAVTHVVELIRASYALFKQGFYAPSVFVSITVFEEMAKIKAGHTRSRLNTKARVKRGKDPLFNHGKKHKISVDPLYLIGDRIANSIGHDRAVEIFKGYETGEYSEFREKSLYFSRGSSGLHIPAEHFDKKLSAEHLLIAIEICADEFWGMTGETSILFDSTNSLYTEVERELKLS
ncbi:AbiV family abortive infection protein [Denitrificimonas caeni]|uniref:AbiV family abortive infection protein n=1 Tax=Denitrificimonas caeni TaxID=521720 RepID=UPI0003B6FA7B|nr:AbiV family abortive infection protein [Denitrificimonas caeni]